MPVITGLDQSFWLPSSLASREWAINIRQVFWLCSTRKHLPVNATVASCLRA